MTYIEPLKERLWKLTVPETNLEEGHLPFVIVVKSDLVAAEKTMTLVEREGKPAGEPDTCSLDPAIQCRLWDVSVQLVHLEA